MQTNTFLPLIYSLLFFISSLSAQKQVSVYIGGTLSHITNIDKLEDFRTIASIGERNHFRTYPIEGMLFGFCFKRQLNKKWNLITKLGYAGMGQRAIELSDIPNYTEAYWISKQKKANYLNVASSIAYTLNHKINLSFGVQVQYLHNSANYFAFSQRSYNALTGLSFQEFSDEYGNVDFGDWNYYYHTKIDWGINIGFTYRLSKYFSIDVSAYKGLRSIDIVEILPEPNTPYIRRNVSYGAALVVDIPRWKKEIISVINSKKIKK